MYEFTKNVKDKGWLMGELAERWGISSRQMSNIARKPKQIHLDALAGLMEKPDFQVGDTVVITSGVFCNMQGKIRKIIGENYWVGITIFGKEYEVPTSLLKKI